ncbi:hypothetical protein AHAS_Ahas16G0044000 [Arachis hypogaea]
MFGVTVSSIWYFRNRFIFEGDSTAVWARVEQVKVQCNEIVKVIKTPTVPNHNHSFQKQVINWSSPMEGRIKMNVDSSFLSQANSAVCGGIFRNHLGQFVKGFTCNLGSCSSTHAELWRIICGL